MVNCTAEGVVFVEADADVRLEDFGRPRVQPFPCVEELLCYDGAGEAEEDVVGKPLLFFQVTRLRNNDGFAIGYRYCHSDDVYRLARGEALPNQPVWERELLTPRAPPRRSIIPTHRAYEQLPRASAAAEDIMLTTPLDQMVVRHFRFGPKEMAALRRHVPKESTRLASRCVSCSRRTPAGP
ncbi:hypothetical protein EJB05_28273, partial [Eragrostis curvula]